MRLLLISLYFSSAFCEYIVPDAKVEVFRPKGLRVSIPDEAGIKLFAFHAKINEEMNGREGGTLSRDIVKAKNGRWTFYDPSVVLHVGDIIYYWTYVDYFDGTNKLGYTNDDQMFVVEELLEKESKPCTNSNQANCKGRLIFSEDFDDLKNNIWTTEVKFASSPDYEFVLYGQHPRNMAVKNGRLEIRPLPSEELYGQGFVHQYLDLGSNCTGIKDSDECVQEPTAFLILPPVASAQITTKNKWSFKYGKIEIRAKLPSGDWIYPELYLNSKGEEYGPGYASGQIRIAFVAGNADSARHLYGGCVLGDSKLARSAEMKTMRKNGGSWCDDFHKFTVVWAADRITVSVDDVIYGNIYPPENGFVGEAQRLGLTNRIQLSSGTKFAPFDKEMYLTIGVGVGGHNFEDRSDGSKPWRNREAKQQKKFYIAQSQWRPTWGNNSNLIVDYVKVWAL